MNSGAKGLLFTGLLLATSVIATWLVATGRPRSDGFLLEEVQRENADLRSQLQVCSNALADLQTTRILPENHPAQDTSSLSAPGTDELINLNWRIQQLALAQANASAMLQKLVSHFPDLDPPEVKKYKIQTNLAVLAKRIEEQRQEVETWRQQIDELALSVPEEVRKMDDESGLRDRNFESYWPYFQARAQHAEEVRFQKILENKLSIEKIDAKLAEVEISTH